jgi:hypothetical protein
MNFLRLKILGSFLVCDFKSLNFVLYEYVRGDSN